MFANIFNFSPTKVNPLSTSELLVLFFQQTVVYFSSSLAIIFFLTILLTRLTTNSLKFNALFNFIKYINILCLSIILFNF